MKKNRITKTLTVISRVCSRMVSLANRDRKPPFNKIDIINSIPAIMADSMTERWADFSFNLGFLLTVPDFKFSFFIFDMVAH